MARERSASAGRRWTDGVSPARNPFREHDACGVGFVAHPRDSSHRILRLALGGLARVAHRGATGADRTGDGAGLLTRIPEAFFRRDAARRGLPLPPEAPFGVGAFFLPRASDGEKKAAALIEKAFTDEGVALLAWRDVPVRTDRLGDAAEATRPAIRHAFVGMPAGVDADEWERRLYLAGRVASRRARAEGLDGFCAVSVSARTIVYKALLTGTELKSFYPDLEQPDYTTPIALFHQRYSTNTVPSWGLAQPFHLLAHNGEINTLWGNRNAMRAREPELSSPLWGERLSRLVPVLTDEGSDSTSLDEALELLVRSGRDPLHALTMLIPDAPQEWTDEALRAFYDFHAGLVEPWDGPAAVAFSDGIVAGAHLDRSGLRPLRYKIAKDGLVVAASEAGIVDLEPEDVVESGRLGPGETIAVDTATGEILRDRDVKARLASRRPWGKWVARHLRHLKPVSPPAPAPDAAGPPDASQLLLRQAAHGWGVEDARYVLAPMAAGQEPLFSMGDDAPIPPLSKTPQPLYAFFRQRFSQVTNPPIDSLRETLVMSLRMDLGKGGSLLLEEPGDAHFLTLEHPVLLEDEMAGVLAASEFRPLSLDATFEAAGGERSLMAALEDLSRRAEEGVRAGSEILVITDRATSRERAAIPSLLALGAVREHLLRAGLRYRVGLVVESGDARDVHHLAVLHGFGAEAVHPWLAIASVRALAAKEGLPGDAAAAFRASAEKGLRKVLAKMGISALSSYCGGQVFDAIGLAPEVMERCFRGTSSPLSGLGFAEITADLLACHRTAWEGAPGAPLPDHGRVRYRKDAEEHAWAPPIVVSLQKAAKGSEEAWAEFRGKADARGAAVPRDLLGFSPRHAVQVEEVESAHEIRKRFIVSAMSLGALSPEMHETLAIAMNRMGARSNSGEGGEDPETWRGTGADRRDNKIKQVASARFGVTAAYLVRADELEIKMAQGAKPGEGGQLPAHKNSALIARLRHAVPGIALISPPPHHDIYSIEDLAQLIHDLKEVNPRARVGVKLVAEAGVGRVAAGVAKAYADYVLIAGHSGGTGASPLSSIKHAGSPWELGLAETQHALVENNLRTRIEVRVDGGLRTAKDVVIAACLGAESFGFGTAPLIAAGCAMARQCHLNTCPTGIATQREDLRKKFRGTPDQIVAYFTFLAEDVREILASLGARSLDEIVGRADLLTRVERPEAPRAALLDTSLLLQRAGDESSPRRRMQPRNDRPRTGPQFPSLDSEILPQAVLSLGTGRAYAGSFAVRNHNLSVGAHLSGEFVRRYGELPPGAVRLKFRGPAGQSFGAFAIRGLVLELEGEANDGVGKGLSGAEIIVKPFPRAGYAARAGAQTILGNAALYGATSGRLFAAGRAGDRFAVRNSGAVAVVEGLGAHGCEYMTGGVVVVLGSTGANFGAGMTNGVAFVLDEDGRFASRCNTELVSVEAVAPADEEILLPLIGAHFERTASAVAARVLKDWETVRPFVRRVTPRGTPVVALSLVPPPEEELPVPEKSRMARPA
jgi:glutamate synthase (NADPH/NADH) large chain/glutamate synthase (ferredoxin)